MSSETNSIATSLLPEFDLEMTNTRKTLDPRPRDRLRLEAAREVVLDGRARRARRQHPRLDDLDAHRRRVRRQPRRRPGLVPEGRPRRRRLSRCSTRGSSEARAALAATSDATFLASWSLLANGEPLFTMPRVAVVRSFVMNHLIHHRAQLCVYLRLNDIPVPALYGPSADEQG